MARCPMRRSHRYTRLISIAPSRLSACVPCPRRIATACRIIGMLSAALPAWLIHTTLRQVLLRRAIRIRLDGDRTVVVHDTSLPQAVTRRTTRARMGPGGTDTLSIPRGGVAATY